MIIKTFKKIIISSEYKKSKIVKKVILNNKFSEKDLIELNDTSATIDFCNDAIKQIELLNDKNSRRVAYKKLLFSLNVYKQHFLKFKTYWKLRIIFKFNLDITL